ncbi:MAG: ABC transporter permease [Holosporales bacterium]|jgi:lipoprotein-releasing system permease protein|nr:ABC transporter permease [Holosporales bacterium]
MTWEYQLAIKYLRAKKNDGFLSVITGFSFLGICLGVATLIIVMSVMGGFREELLTRIIGMKGHILVYAGHEVHEDDELRARIRKCEGVTQVSPMVEKQSIIVIDEKMRGALVLGISPEDLLDRDMLLRAVYAFPEENKRIENVKNEAAGPSDKTGSCNVEKSLGASTPLYTQNERAPTVRKNSAAAFIQKDFSGDAVLIGKRMAELMSINLGDMISLMDPQGEQTPFGTVPSQRDFTVIGFFEVGMIEYDKNVIIMPLKTAQDFFHMDGTLTQFEIFTDNVESNDKIVQKVRAVTPQNLMVLGWKHGDSHFFQAVQVERNVMFLILTLIILIASFNIISGLVMLVKDKTHDIAIMKTIGASRRSIQQIFIITGSSIGVLGTALGVAIGIIVTLHLNGIASLIQRLTGANLFSAEVYFLSSLPYKLSMSEVGLIAFLAIALSILATIYPSYRAGKLDPAVAIRES